MLRFLKEYFSLSNNEQRGIIGLLLIILFVFGGSRAYFMWQLPREIPQDNTALIALLENKSTEDELKWQDNPEVEEATVFFNFDPNSASKEDLLALGLKESVAATLLNFRSQGGKFYKKEDLKKVYGISEAFYEKVEDYILIPQETFKHDNANSKTEKAAKFQEQIPVPIEKIYLNLNAVDSASLTSIKGVGPAYASRIIKYKKLLGGFRMNEQLLEVYGITPEVYEGIKNQVFVAGPVTQIPVNTATWYELKNHPYISSEMANILLNYKKAHGSIENFHFLLESKLVTEEEFNKIIPYLSIEK